MIKSISVCFENDYEYDYELDPIFNDVQEEDKRVCVLDYLPDRSSKQEDAESEFI